MPFTPTEARIITHVLRDLTGWTTGQTTLAPVTIPMVWKALDDPSEALVEACRYDSRQGFFDSSRALRDALGSLCQGELEGALRRTLDVPAELARPDPDPRSTRCTQPATRPPLASP